MSLFSVQARKHTTYYDHLLATPAPRTPGRERNATDTGSQHEVTSEESACEDGRRSIGQNDVWKQPEYDTSSGEETDSAAPDQDALDG